MSFKIWPGFYEADEIINRINSKNYDGIYFNSLSVPTGILNKKYVEDVNEFSKYDTDFLHASNGLFLTKRAKDSGLAIVVGSFVETPEALEKARELGAEVVDALAKGSIREIISGFYKQFND